MRRLVAWNLMTLDGHFEGRQPWDLGFHERVWGEELEAFSLQQGEAIGTLLFGRRTYEGMVSHWTTATGAVADMMNSIEKAVATRTLEKATWNNTRLLKGDAVEAVNGLKAESGKDIYVFGSADLLASLIRRGSSMSTASASPRSCWVEATRSSSRRPSRSNCASTACAPSRPAA